MAKHTLVQTLTGDLQGVRRHLPSRHGHGRFDSAAFLGIPFAEAPTGALRFRAPRPRRPWTGLLDATRFGATPLRHTLPGTSIPEPAFAGEDTLNVNVFSPDPTPGAGLPVLVYIHGGGYFSGSPSGPWFDGATFNRDGVVVVSVSYRLGFEGFGWVYGAPHNRGFLDQIAALQWVQANIEAFGGDPARVTIAGQSAGGGSVLALVLSPLTKGLFGSAIVQSGALTERTLDQAERHGRRFAHLLGVEPTLDACSSLDSETIWSAQQAFAAERQARSLAQTPAERVAGMFASGGLDDMLAGYAPYIDGVVTTGTVDECVRRGQGLGMRVLSGATLHEFVFAMGEVGDPVALFAAAGLWEQRARAFVDVHADLPADLLPGMALTDLTFRGPLYNWTLARNAVGAGPRTWTYTLAFRGANGLAGHCMELPFVFDVLDEDEFVPRLCGPNPPQALADAMHSAWVSFITDGDPGWENALGGEAMRFDTHSSLEPMDEGESVIAHWLSEAGTSRP